MSDLFSTLLNGTPSNIDIKKTKNERISTPILYKSSEKIEYTFIVDEFLNKRQISVLKKLIEHYEITNYQILYALQIRLNEKDIRKTQWKLYTANKWDFTKYIPKWSKIISFGKSIYSICESNDLDASIMYEESNDTSKKKEKLSIIAGFYDTLQEESYFLDPRTKCVVFPVDKINELFNKDTGLFLDKFETWFLKKQIKRAIKYNIKPCKIKEIKSVYIDDPTSWFLSHMNDVHDPMILSCDLETKKLDMFSSIGLIECFTFSFYDDPYIGYYIDFNKIDIVVLEKFLLKYDLLGSYFSYDLKWFVVKAKLPKKIIDNYKYDTRHLSQIYNTLQRNSLKSNVWQCTWYGGYDQPLEKYKEEHPEIEDDYSLIPFEFLFPYASKDPCMSILVHKELERLVHELDEKYPVQYIPNSKWSMWKFYTDIRIPTQKVFIKAEIKGMEINWEKVKKLDNFVFAKIKNIEEQLHKAFNTTSSILNLTSNTQVGELLEKLGWTNYGIGKTKTYNVNSYTLEKWEEEGHKEAILLKELHEINTIYKTFIHGYFQYKKEDGKIHCTFGVGLNSTGRNNCKNPNFQNLSKHKLFALQIRDYFTPTNEDFALVEEDGASLQLRIEASLSEDKTMMDLFKNNIDMHTVTAHLLFGKEMSFKEFESKIKSGDKKYKNYRQNSKAPNFSLVFNTTSLSFALQSLYQGEYKWKLEQCKEYIKINNLEKSRLEMYNKLLTITVPRLNKKNYEEFSYYWAVGEDIKEKWMNKYEGIKEYIQKKILEGTIYGVCFTPFGFIRRVPYLKYIKGKDEDKGRTKNYQNIMTNVEAQLYEWVLISKSMIAKDKYIEDHNYESYICGNVHDSIVSITKYTEAFEVIKASKEAFEEDIPENKGVPHILEAGFGIWGFDINKQLQELKDVDLLKKEVKDHIMKKREELVYGV